jgi:hypothetical protein
MILVVTVLVSAVMKLLTLPLPRCDGSRLQGDRQSENVSKRNAVESAKQRQRVQPPGHQVTWLTEVSGESEKTEINL